MAVSSEGEKGPYPFSEPQREKGVRPLFPAHKRNARPGRVPMVRAFQCAFRASRHEPGLQSIVFQFVVCLFARHSRASKLDDAPRKPGGFSMNTSWGKRA